MKSNSKIRFVSIELRPSRWCRLSLLSVSKEGAFTIGQEVPLLGGDHQRLGPLPTTGILHYQNWNSSDQEVVCERETVR